ncbi:SRPBCC family protein [Minwuia thermotolerans]|nr:SRPBCC family protein [Minwuia thermotolerans]
MTEDTAAGASHELEINRLLRAPRAAIYRAWTEPQLLKRWFCPAPWTIAEARVDVRAGGSSHMVMQGPDGERITMRGVYLEVVPGERIVFTDAYVRAWEPSEKPFFTASVDLTDEDGGTRYIARATHWTEADRKAHEEMGFHEGWNICADQLERLAQELAAAPA